MFEIWKYVKMYVCAYNIIHAEGNEWKKTKNKLQKHLMIQFVLL